MKILLMSIPCWLIPALVGLICAILGYLLGKLLNASSDNNVDVDVYKNRISKLETDLASCMSSKEVSHTSGAANTIAPKTSGVKAVAFNADEAKAALGKKVKENDLTIVEGIGPKIKELFHNHNVTTWADLANCTVEKCQEVLKSGGKRFEIHKPGTWPKQAEMAAKGEWQKLKDWQDQLDGGK